MHKITIRTVFEGKLAKFNGLMTHISAGLSQRKVKNKPKNALFVKKTANFQKIEEMLFFYTFEHVVPF